jgi:hypothetical protein
VQRLPTFAERVLLALVRSGEVAVGGGRDLALDLAHTTNLPLAREFTLAILLED